MKKIGLLDGHIIDVTYGLFVNWEKHSYIFGSNHGFMFLLASFDE